jgi:hypothetical protein
MDIAFVVQIVDASQMEIGIGLDRPVGYSPNRSNWV